MYAYLIEGDTAVKTYYGDNPPDGWYQSKSPIDWSKYYWDGNGPALKAVEPQPEPEPYVPSLKDYKQWKVAEVNDACGRILLSGFYCDVLGEQHRYDTDIVDQINFAQAMQVAQSTGKPTSYRIWNTDDVTKEWYPHTYEQFQAVMIAAADWKYRKLYLCSEYKNAIERAQSIEEIDTIVTGVDWEQKVNV
ncbi:hypothetical protein ALO_12341 [Acetonema longum DSM 6540]|uniref:DUF4376 domain-containing protein n=2 Tax=Acetonema TaxID=2373 RepID=F7NK55_9FIRM|nr:hypothetical protein ALO_12341 [Acetonema longum DSM 6540]